MSCGNSRSSKCNPCGPSEAAMNEIANKAAYYARIAQYASDEFNKIYLGAKNVAPTTDNDGLALQDGALYFNTVSNILFVWDGSNWLSIYDDEIYLGGFAIAPTLNNQGLPLISGNLYWNTVSNNLWAHNGTSWIVTNFNEFTNFMLPSATPVDAINLVNGLQYEIAVVGTTNWVAIGASSATVGVRFTKNAVAATGTGTARRTRDLVERFADVVNVKDFGAVGDGVTDDTAAIQTAIDYVYSRGGGIVECFETFKVNSTLNVKDNVSLKGQAIYPWAGKSATTFDISGKNSRIILNPSATIQVRNSSGLQGLIINRQGLVTGENPTTWTGTAVTVLGIAGIYEVTILGFNQAIDATSSTNGERSGGSKYFKIWFDCNNGIKQSAVYEMSHMYECMGNDITGATTTYRNGSAFEFSNGVDWSRAIGCFSYGYSRGFKLNNTNNVTLIGCGSDGNGDIGVEIIGTSRTTTISNHTFAAVNTGVYIDNSTSIYPDTQISDSGWHDVSAYGVRVISGNVSVTGCSFNRTVSSTGIRIENNDSYSIIQNNLFYGNGTPLTLNGLSQDKSNVSNNKFIGTQDLTTGAFQTFDNAQDSIVYRSWTSAQVGARLIFDKARGNSTTQLPPNNADINTSILGRGYTGTTWGDTSWIRSQFVGTPGAANTAGNIIFSVTPVGSLSTIDRVIFDADGHISPITDNSITCGRAGQRWSSVWAANGTIQTSDERVKKDIEESKLGLDFITSLRPVSYKWIEGSKKVVRQVFVDKDGNEIPEGEQIPEGATPRRIIEESISGERTHFGLLAQEVKAALPNGVDFGGWVLTDKENPDSQQALRYDQFIAPLIKAVQEQQKQIEELSAEVAALKSK